MKKEHCCAIIGQHPLRFPWGFDEEADECRRMKLELAQHIMALRQRGVTEFQIACDPGVGLYSGEIINIVREKDKAMHLTCVLPFEGQATKWTPQLRERYFNMLADCTDISYIAFHKQSNAQFLAYQHIIKQSNLLMAVYDPSLANGSAEDEAITYALMHSKQTMLIHPATWEVKWINMPKGNVEMSRNVQSGNTQNLKSTVIQRSFPKWSVAERRKTAAASDQAAVCACAHSRYFTGGSPSGLRV